MFAVVYFQAKRIMAKATLIDGKAMAAEVSAAITKTTADLTASDGLRPGLAVVIVGEDPASQVYVRNKKRTAESCGFHSVQHTLSADASQDEVLALIADLNADAAIHGILVQLPLPDQLDELTVTQSIVPEKDVDGFHFQNIGMLTSGNTASAFVPCTPAGCMFGRSNIVGKPMASLLLKAHATVTICHSRTKDLPQVARNGDILVAAVGRPRMVKGDWIKPGAVVIDVGINRIEVEVDGEMKKKLTGDVDFDEAVEVAGAITPVPGGVGPMTIAMLMSNTLQSAQRSIS
jgi:methylenetetrahydrofolate dehydrogenase (NADP+)/methenyltetrahydrofolate cyclohydrolase